jgi:hypothetical protein
MRGVTMRFSKVIMTWFIIINAYLWTILIAIMLPSISSGMASIFHTLDNLTHGLATPLLWALIIPGLAVTIWYARGVISIARSKTSSIHIAASTMHEAMFRSDAEKRARAKFREMRASPDPHIFIWAPTDKRVDGKLIQEVLE